MKTFHRGLEEDISHSLDEDMPYTTGEDTPKHYGQQLIALDMKTFCSPWPKTFLIT